MSFIKLNDNLFEQMVRSHLPVDDPDTLSNFEVYSYGWASFSIAGHKIELKISTIQAKGFFNTFMSYNKFALLAFVYCRLYSKDKRLYEIQKLLKSLISSNKISKADIRSESLLVLQKYEDKYALNHLMLVKDCALNLVCWIQSKQLSIYFSAYSVLPNTCDVSFGDQSYSFKKEKDVISLFEKLNLEYKSSLSDKVNRFIEITKKKMDSEFSSLNQKEEFLKKTLNDCEAYIRQLDKLDFELQKALEYNISIFKEYIVYEFDVLKRELQKELNQKLENISTIQQSIVKDNKKSILFKVK